MPYSTYLYLDSHLLIALLNLSVLGFLFVLHDKAQQGDLLVMVMIWVMKMMKMRMVISLGI